MQNSNWFCEESKVCWFGFNELYMEHQIIALHKLYRENRAADTKHDLRLSIRQAGSGTAGAAARQLHDDCVSSGRTG